MINHIDKLRRDILLYKKEFFNLCTKNNVDIQLSSLVNLRYLIFSNLNIDKNFKSEIQKNNFIKQISNFFYLKNYSTINFFGNLEKIKKVVIVVLYYLGQIRKVLIKVDYTKMVIFKFLV